ncbi:MAG: AAA family ATPase [Chloroflexota bacterium]|nr:AAA family ATPase [Chloroflexota bacterium]
MLIGGEAGIGKTTLADALCREAEQRGAFVLIGRCFDLAETPPYGPWVEAFRRYEPTAGLPPVPAAFAQRGTVGAVSSQSALFEQIHDFFAALTPSRPAVLLLDDYHWADAASLDLLRFLARDCAALPLLVLVTYRSDELTRRHPLYTLLPTLVRESSATRLDLRHLDDAAVRTLISQRYGLDEADVARLTAYLQARAEGNGLFLTELLRTLEEQAILHETTDGWQVSDLRQVSIPALLRQVIDGRIARLGEEAQRLLAVAAIIGHEVAVDVWATIAQRDEEAMLTLIERAADAQVLDESADGTMVRFSHALIRETLVAGVSASRRRTMHRRVGETLAALPNADPDAVAYHFQQASDDRAAEWLLRAGERAQRAYAWLTAAARFEAALALREQEMEASERGWLLFRIALLRRHADRSQSLNDLERAEQAAIEAGDALLAAYARFDTGLVLGYQGQGHRCVTLMREAVAALDAMPAPDTATVARLRAMGIEHDPENQRGTLALWVENYGDYAEARLLGEQVVERIAGMRVRGGLDGAFAWDAYRTLGSVYAMLGQPVPARQMYDRNLDAYRAVGDSFQMGITIMRTMTDVILPYRSENHVERQRLADQVEEAFARARSVTPYPSRIGYFALLRLEGNWKEARDLLLALRAGSSSAWSPSWTASELGLLAWQLGDTTLAWTLVNEHFPHGAETAPGEMLFRLGTLLIRLAIALALDAGDRETAEAWLAMHDRWLAWSGAVLGQSEGEALWAGYHRIAGDTQQAYRHAEQALAHATEPRQPLALLAAHRLLGELDTDAERYEDAATHLDASLKLADACQAPFERALTLLAMAGLRAAMGEHDAARALIDEVKAICEPLGAQPTLARAAALGARLT